MRILLEPGTYTLENVGDVAMLQVAVRRLQRQWPGAAIRVVTEAPERLADVCPGTEAIVTRKVTDVRKRRAGSAASRLLSLRVWKRWVGGKQNTRFSKPDAIAELLRRTDLLVVSGMGAINDSFSARALRLLDTVEMAVDRRVPVAFFGQGIGPIRDPAFRERVARALRRVDLLALRERLAGPRLLDEIGVPRNIVRVTGDDAIELAYDARPQSIGAALGINVRVAEYAGVDDTIVNAVRDVLRATLERVHARVLPVPISHRHGGLDAKTNRALLRDIEPDSDGGATLLTSRDVIGQVGHCRVVVTGSYHAGVFALAQGVPVVALVNSTYYADKFRGLADMFGGGCEIVTLRDDSFRSALSDAITRAWASVDHIRASLLTAAARQVHLGHDAYRELDALVAQTAAIARA